MRKFLMGLVLLGSLYGEEKPMVVVIPSYNNEKWCEKNLESIFEQAYDNYRVIYIDDTSSDKTWTRVKEFCAKKAKEYKECSFREIGEISASKERFSLLAKENYAPVLLVHNEKRQGALANLYYAIHSCQDEEIVLTVDGDDWLFHPRVLEELNTLYASDQVWLTHGTFLEYPSNRIGWSAPIPENVVKQASFRKARHPSHLRTFYSWLFKKIRLEDLLYKGSFFAMTWDLAMMYPMIEMAGERHAFNKSVSYVYNRETPLNDDKVDQLLQHQLRLYLLGRPSYARLE